MITEFAVGLEATSLSDLFRRVMWVIPAVQTVHILAIAVVMSSMAMLDLRLLHLIEHPHSVGRMARRFLPWTWTALGVLLASGSILIIAEPQRELLSPMFWIKMGLILLAIPITLLLHFTLRGNEVYWSLSPGRRWGARAIGVLSFIILVCILSAGRWIAYYQAP